jgi:hypothetical protein
MTDATADKPAAPDLWRAQREHAAGEAMLASLNAAFYRRCAALGILPPIGPSLG